MGAKKQEKQPPIYRKLDTASLRVLAFHYASNRRILGDIKEAIKNRQKTDASQLKHAIDKALEHGDRSDLKWNPYPSTWYHDKFTEYASLLVVALDIERAIIAKTRNRKHILYNGKLLESSANGPFLYQFNTDDEIEDTDESLWQIEIADRRCRCPGTIHSVHSTVVLSVKDFYGSVIPEATITVDHTHLSKILAEIYRLTCERRFFPFNTDLVMAANNLVPTHKVPGDLLVSREYLNDEQWNAVQHEKKGDGFI